MAEGYATLRNKLEHLRHVRRAEIAQRIGETRALGDLTENVEYNEARREQARLEQEISELENQIAEMDAEGKFSAALTELEISEELIGDRLPMTEGCRGELFQQLTAYSEEVCGYIDDLKKVFAGGFFEKDADKLIHFDAAFDFAKMNVEWVMSSVSRVKESYDPSYVDSSPSKIQVTKEYYCELRDRLEDGLRDWCCAEGIDKEMLGEDIKADARLLSNCVIRTVHRMHSAFNDNAVPVFSETYLGMLNEGRDVSNLVAVSDERSSIGKAALTLDEYKELRERLKELTRRKSSVVKKLQELHDRADREQLDIEKDEYLTLSGESDILRSEIDKISEKIDNSSVIAGTLL